MITRPVRRRLSSLSLQVHAKKYKNPEDWVSELFISVYNCWFILQAVMVDSMESKTSSVNSCLQMLNLARIRGIRLNEQMYCSCLVVCAKAKETKMAEAIFEEMKQSGIHPSTSTYNAYTIALADGSAISSRTSMMLAEELETYDNSGLDDAVSSSSDPENSISVSSSSQLKLLRKVSSKKISERWLNPNKDESDDEKDSVDSIDDSLIQKQGLDVDWSSLLMNTHQQCPSCEQELLDSEIMAGWADDHLHVTSQCIQCQAHRFIPHLKVKYRIRKADGSGESRMNSFTRKAPALAKMIIGSKKGVEEQLPKTEEKLPNLGEGDQIEPTIHYLSPILLQKELESAIRINQRNFSSHERFRREYPILFWNLMWFFSHQRLSLDALVGAGKSSSVHIRLLLESDLTSPSRRYSKKLIWRRNSKGSSNSAPLKERILDAIREKDVSTAIRLVLKGRSPSAAEEGEKIPQTHMYHFLEKLYTEEMRPREEDLERFLKEYQEGMANLPFDLQRALNSTDRAPGTLILAIRRTFRHEIFFRQKELFPRQQEEKLSEEFNPYAPPE